MNFQQVEILGPLLKEKVIDYAKINASSYAGRKKENLSPSIDYMCMTKAYFNFKFSGNGYLEPAKDDEFSYENERAKVVGNQFHEYIQDVLAKIGIVKLCEKTLIDAKNKIKARLDLLVEIKNTLYLVELKSCKSYAMKKMKDNNSPDEEHIKQTQLYFHLLNEMKDDPDIKAILKGRTVTKSIIFYEEKDSHKITEFIVPKNQKMINDLLKYSQILIKHVMEGKEPEFKLAPSSPECMYKCKPEYYKLCHGIDRDKVGKNQNIEIPKEASGMWGITDAKNTKQIEKFI